jgi:hypothetical protein
MAQGLIYNTATSVFAKCHLLKGSNLLTVLQKANEFTQPKKKKEKRKKKEKERGGDKAIPVTDSGGPSRHSHFSRQLTQMAMRISASCASCHLPPRKIVVLSSSRSWIYPRAIVQPEELNQLKGIQ